MKWGTTRPDWRWKAASKKIRLLHPASGWLLLRFLLPINVSVLKYHPIIIQRSGVPQRERGGICILHRRPTPYLQVFSLTNNLKFAPETTLVTSSLQQFRFPPSLAPISLLVRLDMVNTDGPYIKHNGSLWGINPPLDTLSLSLFLSFK